MIYVKPNRGEGTKNKLSRVGSADKIHDRWGEKIKKKDIWKKKGEKKSKDFQVWIFLGKFLRWSHLHRTRTHALVTLFFFLWQDVWRTGGVPDRTNIIGPKSSVGGPKISLNDIGRMHTIIENWVPLPVIPSNSNMQVISCTQWKA